VFFRPKHFFKMTLFGLILCGGIDCAHSRSLKTLPWPWFREIRVCIEAMTNFCYNTRLTKLCKKLLQVLLKLSLKKFSLKTLFKVIYAILKQETFFLNSFTTNFGKINFYHKNNHAKINCFRWESNLSLLHRKREQNQWAKQVIL